MPRKSAEEKIILGTFRPERDGDPTALPASGIPTPPPSLQGKALEFWNQLIPGIIQMGHARATDSFQLACMCEFYANYRDCMDTLAREGFTCLRAPRIQKLATAAYDKFNSIASRFGLTTSDRAKIRTLIPPTADTGGVKARKRNA